VSGTEPHPCKPPACSACVLRARTHPSRSGRPRASLSRPQWGIGSQGEREPNAARILASVVRTMADVFPLRRRRPSEAGRGCLPLREGRRRAIPNTRWPTSVTTSCSIRSLRGLSWNHAANRCIIPIARSVASNKSSPALRWSHRRRRRDHLAIFNGCKPKQISATLCRRRGALRSSEKSLLHMTNL
jgi:hypothetical protein